MMAMRRYRDYDNFAWLYARQWGQEFHREAIPVLQRLLLNRLPARAAILDLCCGDGRITQALARRGFRMTGLDGSENMLAYARQRLRRPRLILADARNFTLPPEYDAVISMFDSLNHVMSSAGLGQVFRNVFDCLKPGGEFVFDLNREEAYSDVWARQLSIVERTFVAVARGFYESESMLASCDITLFRLEDQIWRRSDFRLTQHCHKREEVLACLSSAGFEVKVFDAGDLGMQGDIGFGRDFYLGTKPLGSGASS